MDEGPIALPEHGPGSRVRRIVFLSIAGAALLAVLVAFREVLAPFMVALVVAYVFAPLVDRMQKIRVGARTLPRWGAVLILYLGLLGAMATTLAFAVPLLVRNVEHLARDAPHALAQARDEWLPSIDARLHSLSSSMDGASAPEPDEEDEDAARPRIEPARTIRVVPIEGGGFEVVLPDDGIVVEQQEDEHRYVVRAAETEGERPRADLATTITRAIRRQLREGEATATSTLGAVQAFVAATVNGIFKFFIMLMISAYVLISSDTIFAFFRSLVAPGHRERFDTVMRRMDRGLSGVVRGQLVICLVNGVLSGIGFWIIGVHYWPILTLFATVLSIIPIFGAILSSVPAVIVGLQQGVGTALLVLGWIIVIHQIEANLLNPKIMGDAAKVHPVLVVFSLIAGEHFFGILGALLAVPVLSIAQTLFLYFREVALGEPASATSSGIAEVPKVAPPDA
ncbi:MAG: AI-2E family transporter [Sandaracinus sp.]